MVYETYCQANKVHVNAQLDIPCEMCHSYAPFGLVSNLAVRIRGEAYLIPTHILRTQKGVKRYTKQADATNT